MLNLISKLVNKRYILDIIYLELLLLGLLLCVICVCESPYECEHGELK